MNETIHSAIEVLSSTDALIGAAVGYAAGQLAEWEVLKTRAANRLAWLPAHENVDNESVTKRTRLNRAVTGLALMGALTGYATGQAIDPHETITKTKPTIELVVDHSRDVQTGRLGDGAVNNIDSIAATIMKNKGVYTRPVVSHGSLRDFDVKTIKAIIEDGQGENPDGSPSVADATSDAQEEANNNSQPVKTNSLSTTKDRNAALLVITDGNTLGDPGVVITKSHENGNIPVFIADTGSSTNTTDVSNVADFKKITLGTHGEYWHVPKNASDIESAIKNQLSSQETKNTNDALRYLAAFFALTVGGETFRKWYDRRRTLDNQESINS